MVTLNYTTLRVSGALKLRHLAELEMHVTVNTHGWAVLSGVAEDSAMEQLNSCTIGEEVVILAQDESGREQPIFSGIIHEVALVGMLGWDCLRVELRSGTILLDHQKRSRSFQAVDKTYSKVAEEVVSAYSGGAVISSVGEAETIDKPLIQYRETDWEFLIRIASHVGGVVVPEVSRGFPRIWFGFPERSATCSFPEDSYESGISPRYYELGGMFNGYDRADFLYYDVCSSQLCDLGNYTQFKGQDFLIMERHGKLERGELLFTYRLGCPGLGWGAMRPHEKISGMSLQGEVLSTSGETVSLKLDIDCESGWNPGGAYSYPWRPETGNLMYCMPQAGTRVALYFPNMDEKQAMVTSCIRTNGGSCARMSDPSKRAFVTEHGKELTLYPQTLSLVGGSNSSITLADDTGITLQTEKEVQITALEGIELTAPVVECLAPQGELGLFKADAETGEVKSSYTQSNQYDLLALSNTAVDGVNVETYPAYEDEPAEAEFDLGGLILNAAVGALITFAFIGLAVLTAGTSVILTGALIGAAVGSGVCTAVITVQDAIDGDVRSLGEAVSQIALSALVGAMAGAAIAAVPFALQDITVVAFKNLLGLKLGSQFISATLIKAGMYGIAGLNAIFAGNNIIGIGSGIDILGCTVFKNHQDLYQFIQFSIAYASMYILGMGMAVEQAQRAQEQQAASIANEGNGGGTGGNNSETVRVGRWMSQSEYDEMVSTGKVQLSGDNKIHVAIPADQSAYQQQAPEGSIYVEFDVSSSSVFPAGRSDWGIVAGPGSLNDRFNQYKGLPAITEIPDATNIEIVGGK